jgi:TPR repeat protein
MNILKILPLIILAQILGCASNQITKRDLASDKQTQSVSIEPEPSMEFARNILSEFSNADPKNVILPYVLLVSKISNISDEAEACLPANIKIYKEMYQLNPSSLLATSLLFGCEAGDEKTLLKYANEYQWIVEYMLTKNNGSSIRNSVKIRELSEAELILATADYTILDQELVKENDRFFYRIHAIDNDSGEFEYHYYDNFDFVKKMYTSFKNNISDKEVTEFSFLTSKNVNNPPTINYQTNVWLKQKKYQEVIDLLEKSDELTPISRLNLARAYLYSKTEDKIDNLIDEIVNQKDLGDINAAIFIAELMIDFNGLVASQADIDELLNIVDGRTKNGYGAYELAKIYKNQNKKAEFRYWSEEAMNKNRAVFYSQIYNFLKNEGDFNSLHEMIESQHLSGNLTASFNLAYDYHAGRGVAVDHRKENEIYLIAANKGHVDSMYELANNLKNGEGVEVDMQQALYWFKLAGEKGHVSALSEIGYIYYKGVGGVPNDDIEAIKWFEKASAAGSSYSMTNLGVAYQYGRGTSINLDKAIEYYKAATEAGSLKAYERLGDFYKYTKGSEYYEEAAEWYQQGALKGHVASQYEFALINARELGNEDLAIKWYDKVFLSDDSERITWAALSFEEGEPYLKVNLDKTVKFYQRAVELGNSQAQANLGFMYEVGEHVELDLHKARLLYEKSARQGEAQGLNNLATFYMDGIDGIEVNLKKAFDLYTEASKKDNKFAHNNLAKMYFNGEYVKVDEFKAFELFNKAAKAEFSDSYFYLGYLYLNGVEGQLEKNYTKAKKYFELSYAVGDSSSAENLAIMHSHGFGVLQNFDKAIMYFSEAAKLSPDITDKNYYIANNFALGINGTKENYKIAHEYYEMSIEDNNPSAMNNLAELYRWGKGVEIDYKMAVSLYLNAAKLNSGIAMYNMAELYRDGHGVVKSPTKSIEWMKKAADKGFANAQAAIKNNYEGI